MSKKVILDTNIFILYIIGLIDPVKIKNNKRTSSYNEVSFENLQLILSNFDDIIICPNIVTEIDNLLNNNLKGDDKYEYFQIVNRIFKNSIEKYVESCEIVDKFEFQELGITDSVLLEMAKSCNLLVSSDSQLCDFARSSNINVLDFKRYNTDILYT